MSEYYKQFTGTPESAAKTTGADRIQADREIWARLTGVEDTIDKMPAVPSIPTDVGDYLLHIIMSGDKKVYGWSPLALPAPPTEAGSYVLKVTVDGTTVTYAWDEVKNNEATDEL